jgi:hypothetical protein
LLEQAALGFLVLGIVAVLAHLLLLAEEAVLALLAQQERQMLVALEETVSVVL